MKRKELVVSTAPEHSRLRQVVANTRLLVTSVAVTAALAFPAFAADDAAFDVSATLVTSFQGMATTILGTVSAVLPIIMSIMSAYICISFGIRFFRRFVK